VLLRCSNLHVCSLCVIIEIATATVLPFYFFQKKQGVLYNGYQKKGFKGRQ
jgi:hypothetical protein